MQTSSRWTMAPCAYWLRGRESNPHGRRLTADRSAFELPRSVRPRVRGRFVRAAARVEVRAGRSSHHVVREPRRQARTPLRRRTVARPGFEPGSTSSEPAILPLDHRAIRNAHETGRCPQRALRDAVVDPKGLEPSRRRVRAAASASRGSGSVLCKLRGLFPLTRASYRLIR
jgi:hypothetical protein